VTVSARLGSNWSVETDVESKQPDDPAWTSRHNSTAADGNISVSMATAMWWCQHVRATNGLWRLKKCASPDPGGKEPSDWSTLSQNNLADQPGTTASCIGGNISSQQQTATAGLTLLEMQHMLSVYKASYKVRNK
jgi:hypothetical protein